MAQEHRTENLKIPTDSCKSPLYTHTTYFVVKCKGGELLRRVTEVTNLALFSIVQFACPFTNVGRLA